LISATASVNIGADSTITVTAKDAYGNVISGIAANQVVLAATDTGSGNTLTQPSSATNGSGQTTGTLSSTYPEAKTVSVTISSVAITQTANVAVNGIKITAPTTGASWAAGSADKNITWASYPVDSRHIKIEYSSNGSSSWQTVLDGASSAIYTGSFKSSPQLWDVPTNATIASTYKIRITDLDNSDVFDSNTFSVPGNITLTAPTGGQKWSRTTAHDITWTKDGTFNTRIRFSTNSGGAWNNLTGGGQATADGTLGLSGTSLNWTPSAADFPTTGSSTVRFEVSDNNTLNPAALSASTSDVTISNLAIGTLSGLSSGRIAIGGTLTIPWTYTGVSYVKLEYYSNTAGAYVAIPQASGTSSKPASDGTFDWTVPDDVGPNVTIRATAVNSSGTQDPGIEGLVQSTSSTFTIFGTLAVTSPNGGESSASTSALSITFTGSSSIDGFKFYYKTSAGGSWNDITSNITGLSFSSGNGSASWTPGASYPTVWLKIEDAADANVSDASNNYFILTGVGLDAAVTSNSPYTALGSATISGTAVVSGNVKLEYSTTGSGGTYSTLGAGATNVTVTSNAFSYNWTVPNSIGSNIYIKVTDLNSSANAIVGPITIKAGITGVTVQAPTNGTFYTVGEVRNISWTTAGTVGFVKLEYYTGTYSAAGAPDIAASTANTSPYSWTVPDFINANVKVVVTDADSGHPAASGESSSFTIRGKLAITTPSALYVGDTQDVAWSVNGDIGNVRIRYASSTDNGSSDAWSSWSDVAAATSSDWTTGQGSAAQNGTYSWINIADVLLAEGVDPQTDPDHAVYMKIRIEDADDASNVYADTTGFLVKYRTITWRVTDPNNNRLSALCVSEGAITTPTKAAWAIGTMSTCADGTFSGNDTVRYYPDNSSVSAETYTTTFANKGAQTVYLASQSGWTADRNRDTTDPIIVTIETDATASQSYEPSINAVYDATNDAINISSWLSQKGVLITDIAKLTAISVNILNASGTVLTDDTASTNSNHTDLGAGKTVNSQGIFTGLVYKPSGGLDPSATYTIKVTITYNTKQYTSVSGFVSPTVFNYEAKISTVYNNSNDSVSANIWLDRAGTTVTDPGTLTFNITDSSGNPVTNTDGTQPASYNSKLAAGIYSNIVFNPTSALSSTEIYTIKATITYRGKTYNAVASFSKGEIGAVQDSINTGFSAQTSTLAALPTSVSNTVTTSVASNIASQLSGQTTTLQGAITSETATLGNQIGTVGANVTALPTTVSTAATTAVNTEMAKGVQAELLTRPMDVATGATVPIRFRTASGLSPKITVYDPNGTARVSAEAMKEISTTGIYEYRLTLKAEWGTGDFTVLVTESTKGSTDSLILHVGLGGLDEIYSKVSSATSSTSGVSLDTIFTGVTTIQNNTNGMNNDITSLLTRLGKATDNEAANTLFGKIAAIDTSTDDQEVILTGINEVKNYVDTLEASLGASGDSMTSTIFGRLAGLEEMMKSLGASSQEVDDAKAKAMNLSTLMEEIKTDLANGNMAEATAKLASLGQGLTSLNSDLSALPEKAGAASVGSAFEDLKNMAASGGLEALVPLLEEIKQGRETFNPENMTGMRNTVEELKSLMTEVRSLLDQEVNKPVVHGWLEEEQE